MFNKTDVCQLKCKTVLLDKLTEIEMLIKHNFLLHMLQSSIKRIIPVKVVNLVLKASNSIP